MSTFSATCDTIVREIRTNVVVSVSPRYGNCGAQPVLVTALWDTGAYSSVVSRQIVDALGLLPIDHKPACGVNGRYDSPVYVVDILLPNRMKIQGVRVSLGAMEVADMLIGMDLISMGDFKLINRDTFDYTEWCKDNLFPDETVDSLYDKIKAYSAAKGERRSATAQEAAR